MAGSRLTEEEILNEHPDLEKADFSAVYQYAGELAAKRISAEAASERNLSAAVGSAAPLTFCWPNIRPGPWRAAGR
jgi:hypothetical protein